MRRAREAENCVLGGHRLDALRMVPPYVIFSRAQWTALRDATSLALSEAELTAPERDRPRSNGCFSQEPPYA